MSSKLLLPLNTTGERYSVPQPLWLDFGEEGEKNKRGRKKRKGERKGRGVGREGRKRYFKSLPRVPHVVSRSNLSFDNSRPYIINSRLYSTIYRLRKSREVSSDRARYMPTGAALIENNEASAKLTNKWRNFHMSSARLSSQSRYSTLDR